MNLKEVLKELKSLGTAQNRKIYARHGGSGDMNGVSFANLGKLKKKIKVNHMLALELWETGNLDARNLAVMVADPEQFTEKQAIEWRGSDHADMLCGMLAGLIAKTNFWKKLSDKWRADKREYWKSTGYAIISNVLKDGRSVDPRNKSEDDIGASVLRDKDASKILKTIEKEIHDSPNRARYSMNNTLISIGVYCPNLTKAAIGAATQIGEVIVDHGKTNCKTPEAMSYIEKALAHRAKRKKK